MTPPPQEKSALRKYSDRLMTMFNILLILAGILEYSSWNRLQGLDNFANTYLGGILIAVAFLNAFIDWFQLQKSEKILASFLAMTPPSCRVVLDGTLQTIPAADLVFGDVVLVRVGDKIPADIVLFFAIDLKVDNMDRLPSGSSSRAVEAENLVYLDFSLRPTITATSGAEISAGISPFAEKVHLSTRGSLITAYPHPQYPADLAILTYAPDNVTLVPEIKDFNLLDSTRDVREGVVEFVNGTKLRGIDHIIMSIGGYFTGRPYHLYNLGRPVPFEFGYTAAGYSYSFPSLPQYHNASLRGNETASAGGPQLVTDGSHIRSLHLDLVYMEEPTVGVYQQYVSTFSRWLFFCFFGISDVDAFYTTVTFWHVSVNQRIQSLTCSEYQVVALASVRKGHAKIPTTERMWDLYEKRLKDAGIHATRTPQKLSGNKDVHFFSVGTLQDRTLVIYIKKKGIGGVVGFCINYGAAKNVPEGHTQWLVAFAVQLIPRGLSMLGAPFLIESPHWLMSRVRTQSSLSSLSSLRNLPSEHESNTSLLTTSVYGIIKIGGAMIWLLYLVDQLGRRSLLMIGSIGGAISMYYISVHISLLLNLKMTRLRRLRVRGGVLSRSFIFGLSFTPTWNGTPWVVGTEFFPQHVRTHTSSCIAASNWLFAFLIARFTPQMFTAMGYGVYLFFASLMISSDFYVYFPLSETKRVPLERMNELFAPDSEGWLPPLMDHSRVVGGKEDIVMEDTGSSLKGSDERTDRV
ncbi:hypothetical protein K435DRAFT_866110 [Dendrothele bispora CBS 962.96]|uniref:P-type ATPase A domain-containing protein n=1 Tax=Dendrothele bispora (strain CBS 962.96) TaxID=1314807 RepID=A0A4S8LHR4_DENBC|nr:hypothetical protein K435DRAFT_866110 [Dendrothele bispora CBS 962.96]